ncbi:MAG: glucosaminidase domain-containing protein [Succinivibrionaceae bacterium]|nr:glucosaminidase domain-containing protein [Succinivibrionaceae bacterium]
MDTSFMADSNYRAADDIGLVGDHRGLNRLRTLGHGTVKEKAMALTAAARQFESMLTERWMDAMRATNETINPDSPLHSKYSKMFEGMLSQQQVGAAAQQGGGVRKNSISYLVARQFAKSMGDEGKEILKEIEAGAQQVSHSREVSYHGKGAARPMSFSSPLGPTAGASVRALEEAYASLPDGDSMRSFDGPEDFVEKMMPYAVKAVEGLGFNPLVLVTQAALETGWGNHVPRGNNYYGIKAGGSWQGETESLSSDEFEGGAMVSRVSSFRKYASVLESMRDYVKLITSNQRYAAAAGQSFNPDQYFDEIQKAGYATDPNYAEKLKAISRKVAFMAYK